MTAKQPNDRAGAGVRDGKTANTDHTRTPDRPVEEEDVFGGLERAKKGEDVESDSVKP
jgi:hypothetical protein